MDEQSGTVLKIMWSNGNLLEGEVASTQVSAVVTRCGVEVTDEYTENAFQWTRDSGDTEADAVWNAAHVGMKSITLTEADLNGDIKLTCTLTASSATYGSVTVDDNLDASHTPAELDANDVFAIENGNLKVTTSRGNAYILENSTLKASGSKLNGSITAESKLFASQPEDVVEFSYDHNGLRTQKKVTKADGTVETTDYTLHGKLLTHLTRGNDTMHFFYDNEKRPTMVEFNGTLYSYIHNLQGDIVGILDSAGNLVVEYKYDAWGKPVAVRTLTTAYAALAELNPFRYRGYVYDEETELYYLRSRYYSPNCDRFINVDSYTGKLGQSYAHNLSAYSYNSPIAFIDKDGYSATTAGAIGVIGSIASSVDWNKVWNVFAKFGSAVALALAYYRAKMEIQTPEEVRRDAGITATMDAATIEAKLLEATTSNAANHLMYEEDYSYYYVACTKNGMLYTIDLPLTFEEAYIVAQGTVITNAVRDQFRSSKRVWGIYTPSSYAASKLASALIPGSTENSLIASMEEHSSTGIPGDYYWHWHTTDHKYHIWYGVPLQV